MGSQDCSQSQIWGSGCKNLTGCINPEPSEWGKHWIPIDNTSFEIQYCFYLKSKIILMQCSNTHFLLGKDPNKHNSLFKPFKNTFLQVGQHQQHNCHFQVEISASNSVCCTCSVYSVKPVHLQLKSHYWQIRLWTQKDKDYCRVKFLKFGYIKIILKNNGYGKTYNTE